MARLDPFLEQVIFDTSITDDVKVTLPGGREVTMGQLRASVPREYVVPDDYNNLRRQSDEQRLALLREKQLLEQQLVEAVAAHNQAPAQAPVSPDMDAVLQMYESDPAFKPMYDRVRAVQGENTALKQTLADLQRVQHQMHQTIQQIPVVMKVQQIQARHNDVDAQKLLEFARTKQMQPQFLDDAYTLMTHDEQVQQAREAGLNEGLERAKREIAMQPPQVPFAPYGPTQTVPTGPPTFENEAALEAAILNDPEMYQVFSGLT